MKTFINRASQWTAVGVLGLMLMGCGNGHPSDTSLHDAARMNDNSAIKAALSVAPGGVDTRDSHMETPFIAAAKVSAMDAMRTLLDAGADVNAKDVNGFTALMWSVYNNQPNTVKFLIDHKADPNLRDNDQETPLIVAAKGGYAEVVAALIYHNGDPVVQAVSHNTDLDAVDPKAARTDNVSNSFASAASLVGQTFSDWTGTSTPKKWTALQYAVKAGRLDIVKMLLDKGANPNTHDSDGWTPLLYAADYGYTEIVRRLVEKGANPNVRAPDGISALARAQKHGYTDMATYLVAQGAQ